MIKDIMIVILVANLPLWVYGWLCWQKPFRICPRCAGSGTVKTRILRRPRQCRRCRGNGARLRWGRALANWLRRTSAVLADEPRQPPASTQNK